MYDNKKKKRVIRARKKRKRKFKRELKSFIMELKKIIHYHMLPIVMVYFEILLRIFTGTGVFPYVIYPVLFGISAGFFVTSITSLFKKRINRIISSIVLFVTAFLFIIECFIKKTFQWYLPLVGIFSSADNVIGNYGTEVWNAILHGIPAILLFHFPGILYVVFGEEYVPEKPLKLKGCLKYLMYSAICMIVSIGIVNGGSVAEQYTSQYKFDTATEYFGLLTSTRLELKYSLFGNKFADSFVTENDIKWENNIKETEQVKETEEFEKNEEVEEVVYEKNQMDLNLETISENTKNEEVKELNAYVNSLDPSSQNKYTGLFEGKNLILICAEAFSDAVISEELTPTLYRMTHNGFYFSDYYQPTWGGSTTTGEFSFLIGLVPMKLDQSVIETKDNNLYFTLGNQLQRKGYYSAAFHNGTYDYYSRHLTHKNLGYSTWTALGNGLENLTKYYPDDEKFFDLTMDTYLKSEEPFSIYYMTMSGHCIYEESNRYTNDNIAYVRSIVGDKYKDTTTYYLCYQMELEYALQTMIEKLEVAGIADDTVICLTSDHYPYGLTNTKTFGNSEDYVSDLYGYTPKTNWENDSNAWILWSGCLENEYKDMVCEIDTPTYSLDIVPTLSNLFGLEYDSRLLVGRDVFSEEEPLVLWNNYSWITTKGKYDALEKKFYPNEGMTVDEEYVENIKKIVKNKITFSKKAINNDYYGVLFGKKE